MLAIRLRPAEPTRRTSPRPRGRSAATLGRSTEPRFVDGDV